jgi:hypothetical protein
MAAASRVIDETPVAERATEAQPQRTKFLSHVEHIFLTGTSSAAADALHPGAARFRSPKEADVMAFHAKRLADQLRRGLRRQEVTAGVITVLLLAVATMAVGYLYY